MVATRKSLKEFFGSLSEESGSRLESSIKEMRRRRNIAHQKRLKLIIAELEK